jgi:hypothetical protein
VHLRRRHSARRAPLRPEIYEDWNASFADNRVERIRPDFNRFTVGRQGCFACSAPPSVR